MIRKEQNESGVNTVSSEISKTAQQSTDPKAHPFPIIEGPKAAPSKAYSLGHYQAKCKRSNFIFLTSLGKDTATNAWTMTVFLNTFTTCLLCVSLNTPSDIERIFYHYINLLHTTF